MAYCTQCGNSVADVDLFCARCGTKQAGAREAAPPSSAPPKSGDFLSEMSPRTASLLCYIPMVGWVAAIIVLASERFRRAAQVRFHAFQGLYLFAAWLLVEWVVAPMLRFDYGYDMGWHRLVRNGLQLAIFAAWILMMVKVSHDEDYRLPILGDLAERSASEQRG